MTIEVLEHTDVRGKILQYLKLTNKKGSDVLINVGAKTYNGVRELIAEENINTENKTNNENKEVKEKAK